MLLTWAAVTALAAACAPTAAPSTLAAIARVESGFDPLAIGVNGAGRRQIHPASMAEAIATATRLVAAGRNIDVGLAQINSANLARLGLTFEGAFDACANLEASGRVLRAAYRSSSAQSDRRDLAVLKALSIYNTGTAERGFLNGYVAKVVTAARGGHPGPIPVVAEAPAAPTPSWDVFARAGRAGAPSFVFSTAPSGDAP